MVDGDFNWLKQHLGVVSTTTGKPWGVGFITWCITQDIVDLALRYSLSVLLSSFGDAKPWIQHWQTIR